MLIIRHLIGLGILPGTVDAGTVDTAYDGDVFRRFHTPLDLQGRHLRIDELRQDVDRAEVLGREEVLTRYLLFGTRPIDQSPGKTARLRAHPTVGAAPTDEGGHEALPRVADAERPMGEDLEVDPLPGKTRDLPEGELPRKRHPRGSQPFREGDARDAAEVHLRGGVHLELGQEGADA